MARGDLVGEVGLGMEQGRREGLYVVLEGDA
jgi:hypothetical protein